MKWIGSVKSLFVDLVKGWPRLCSVELISVVSLVPYHSSNIGTIGGWIWKFTLVKALSLHVHTAVHILYYT